QAKKFRFVFLDRALDNSIEIAQPPRQHLTVPVLHDFPFLMRHPPSEPSEGSKRQQHDQCEDQNQSRFQKVVSPRRPVLWPGLTLSLLTLSCILLAQYRFALRVPDGGIEMTGVLAVFADIVIEFLRVVLLCILAEESGVV